MPLSESIIGIPGFKILKVEKRDPVIIKAECIEKVICPHCGGSLLRVKSRQTRRIRHESIGIRPVYLEIVSRKYLCNNCNRYFNQRFPGILPYKRSTECFRVEVVNKHHDGICQTTLSRKLGIGSATVERWSHDYLKRIVLEKSNYPCPKIIGIDEHFFTKKDGYATTICDISNHRVYDVVLGRSEKALESYFLSLKGRDNVKIIVMDLSETYRNIARKYFSNAKIITDRFHVIRLINHYFMALWKKIDPEGRRNRGLLSLMRRHENKLTGEQKNKLYSYFEKHKELGPIYEYKQKLCRLMLKKHRTKNQVKQLIPRFLKYIEELEYSGISLMESLGRTMHSWSDEMARMWRFSRSNAITEGFHNKMEMISRRAYGFKNFENYRLRVRALCA